MDFSEYHRFGWTISAAQLCALRTRLPHKQNPHSWIAWAISDNTGESLLCALERVRSQDVLWLNGDVVFDHRIVGRMVSRNLLA